ncbi:hypothetical protein CJ030_MR4G003853 [Morella rubra]|uniref:BPL/LPL catalytic domain-containing protein n=1 Tax=Morella rubra TaxID=262757 RepID=A0A6A1VUU0_9ROSI|nr:hypothetical protein CJ030_MR4G003846 [Morella rubra]KAB1216729.1 hypothetical protein CJ030_MR4G003853 [Morella rubra]
MQRAWVSVKPRGRGGFAMGLPEARKLGIPLMNLVRFKGLPILQQLHLEERLLRTSSDNWCIINDGTDQPTIVMGISGKPAELLEIKSVLCDHIPVIRRFTGGGTVIVDPSTIFVTFICNKDAVPGLQPYPRPIMSWSEQIYNKVFQGIGDFHLRENDYVFGNHKFGGNAQSITKNRWIHHTSFLWDYEVRSMAYLKLPERAPEYRLHCVKEAKQVSWRRNLCDLSSNIKHASWVDFTRYSNQYKARDHLEFICRMKDFMPRSIFVDRSVEATKTHFLLRSTESENIEAHSGTKFCHSTRLLTKQELEAAAFAAPSEGALSQPCSL